MRYVSTRGVAPDLGFEDVMLTGLARDGGLYVPAEWPALDWAALSGCSYQEVAAAVMRPFVDGLELEPAIADSYRRFGHPAVAPLKQIGPNDWLMELFHGPTLAFKDYALQLVGRLFDAVLARRGQRMAILGATSGDTGSAAIEAVRDRAAIDIFVLYPHNRVSEVQRRQMTTVEAANVHAIAVEGTFDDCQAILKALFNDHGFRDRVSLGAVNSINWARIIGQVVYYGVAALALGAPHRKVAFSVPTGNFGNVFAAYVARRMGLPIERLVVGTNQNDILARFFQTGTMQVQAVEPTLSPSMDIQVSSNLERLLFELFGRDGRALAAEMDKFAATGRFELAPARLVAARHLFDAVKIDDEATVATIRRLYETTGERLDPHSAIAVAAAQARRGDPRVPMVSLACAHPAKFPDAVMRATGAAVPLPPHLAHLLSAKERVTVLPASAESVRQFMLDRLAAPAELEGVR